MKHIHLLGPRGMLGRMVKRYFDLRGWRVDTVDTRFDLSNLVDHFRQFDDAPAGVFVNCIGAIPQKISDAEGFLLPNLLLPLELARTLAAQHVLIHPSTDCVFRGDRGTPYPADHRPDATDAYGWSKLQAERVLQTRENTMIVRTSIIGPSDAASAGLLQWFLSQPKGAKVTGYTHHRWNGLTTLQWCVEIERMLTSGEPLPSLLQLGTEPSCTKHELLCLLRDVFRPDITVEAGAPGEAVDRRLEPQRTAPPLPAQLEALARFLERS